MRIYLSFFFFSMLSAALGQDPTVPSPKLIERLGIQTSGNSSPLPKLPSLQIAALVMSSPNRGFAVIQCEEKYFDLQLDRSQVSVDCGSKNIPAPVALIIQGTEYYVEDFRSGSITLSDGQRELVVQ
ncbi:MAG TPA: hypothetical protein DCF63_12320 [Planctomycetaceae bacterium]|nr:hypothetical protein [Planctomycetaceae bacterium]